jgi:hypothetical protein
MHGIITNVSYVVSNLFNHFMQDIRTLDSERSEKDLPSEGLRK